MIPAAVIPWVLKHWKDLVIGACVVLVAAFIASWMMRGAKIERQEIELGSKDLQIRNLKTEHKAQLEEIGAKIVEIEDKAKIAKQKSEAKVARLEADLAAVTEEADRAWRESAQRRLAVAESLNRATSCEEREAVFLAAVQERISESHH